MEPLLSCDPSLHTTDIMPHKSPAKRMRSLKRLMSYIIRKLSSPKLLSISTQESISILPQHPNISIFETVPNIPPCKLSEESQQEVSKPQYSPALIQACSAYYKKEKTSLSSDELKKFDVYCKWREKNRKPVY